MNTWEHGYTNTWETYTTKVSPCNFGIECFKNNKKHYPQSRYYSFSIMLYKWKWFISLTRVMNPPTYNKGAHEE